MEDWDFLESALVSWDNLPAVVLKELQQNTPRNDIWAKFFLRQENSSRAQVDEALRVYYALDPDALAQLDVLAKQPDRIWWSTLAKSNLTFFNLPFLFLPESNASLVILMLFCTILTEFCGLLAQTINGIRSYAGPFGKSDRALIFGLWGLAVAIYPQWMQWNNLLWSIASILLLWTAINRCRSVLFMSAER